MYRKEIKVMDCTIRDGGLMNQWQFSDEFVKSVYSACVAAGIDYMEIGYRSSESAFSRETNGPWRFCDDRDLRRIVGENKTDLKLSAMADIGRIDPNDIPPKSESLLDMIRVACYVHQVDKAIALAEHCMDKGYETTINLMAVSTVMERDLDEALSDIARSKVPVFYLVDSFGSMYSEQIQSLMHKYTEALPGKTIGFHGHNNLQLAFANTVEAIIQGSNMLDSTLLGLGRGAGNCHTEILLSFLKNPKYQLRPLIKVIQEYLIPMQKEVTWGYHIPYMLSGAYNQHPRNSLKWMDGGEKENFLKFYDTMLDTKDLE